MLAARTSNAVGLAGAEGRHLRVGKVASCILWCLAKSPLKVVPCPLNRVLDCIGKVLGEKGG